MNKFLDIVTPYLKLLFRYRKLLLWNFIVSLAIIIPVVLLLPNYYKSSATFLPLNNFQMSQSIANLSNLAAMAGVSLNHDDLTRLFPDIINSDTILKQVIYTEYYSDKFKKSVNLVEYWDYQDEDSIKAFELALKKLRDELDITTDVKTGIVSVAIMMNEPALARDIVTNIINDLDMFLRTQHRSNATEQKEWIATRLIDVKNELELYEDSLRIFREKNQLITAPSLMLIQERLLRQIAISTSVYTELKKQYEIAQLEEVKNIPIVNVLDVPRIAGFKERPKRSIIVFLTVFLSIIIHYVYLVITNLYHEEVSKFTKFINKLFYEK